MNLAWIDLVVVLLFGGGQDLVMGYQRFVQNAPWPADEVEKLRAWREAGIGNSEIGKRLGRSPVSVASKVRKLKLPPRSTRPVPPMHGKPRPPEVPRAGRTTLPPLPSLRNE